jgi:hypothetical protein
VDGPKPGHWALGRPVTLAATFLVVALLVVSALVLINGAPTGKVGGAPPTLATTVSTARPIANGSANATVYAVYFNETGLPSGTSWSVTVNGSAHGATTATIEVDLPNGTYNFSVAKVAGYLAAPSKGVVAVAGLWASESIVFAAVAPTEYDVTFTESGLASGTTWSVTFNGTTNSSSTASIRFRVPNGSYSYTVGAVSGYTSSPSSGTIVVSGADKNQGITFTAVPPTTYTVTFTETGLPTGTSWAVTVGTGTNGSTTASIPFTLPNGTYSFTVGSVPGYTSSPSSGSFKVAGANLPEPVTFSKLPAATYTVTFNETGLTTGTSWSVTFDGTAQGSSAKTDVFTAKNGSYSYSVANVSGYTVAPTTGTVPVSGADVSVSITFSKYYAVTFGETGLPSGTNWSVTLAGSALNNTSALITTQATNGSYSFTVGYVAGYASNLSNGVVTVDGAPESVSLEFNRTAAPFYTIAIIEAGLPTGANWSASLNGTFHSSSTNSIAFSEPNGSYQYRVSPDDNWSAMPEEGNISLGGASTIESVEFVFTYLLTFDEPNGTAPSSEWSVTLSGGTVVTIAGQPAATATHGSVASTLTFREPNGSYSYSAAVTGNSGYHASGTVTVAGNSPIVTLPGTSSTSPPPSNPASPQNLLLYTVVGGLVILGIVVLLVVLAISARRKRQPPSEEPEDPLANMPPYVPPEESSPEAGLARQEGSPSQNESS